MLHWLGTKRQHSKEAEASPVWRLNQTKFDLQGRESSPFLTLGFCVAQSRKRQERALGLLIPARVILGKMMKGPSVHIKIVRDPLLEYIKILCIL